MDLQLRLVVFSSIPVSATNKTYCHDRTEILLAVNTINLNQTSSKIITSTYKSGFIYIDLL
jgi:hypothetical protein